MYFSFTHLWLGGEIIVEITLWFVWVHIYHEIIERNNICEIQNFSSSPNIFLVSLVDYFFFWLLVEVFISKQHHRIIIVFFHFQLYSSTKEKTQIEICLEFWLLKWKLSNLKDVISVEIGSKIDTKIQLIVQSIYQCLNPECQVHSWICSLKSSNERYSRIALYNTSENCTEICCLSPKYK